MPITKRYADMSIDECNALIAEQSVNLAKAQGTITIYAGISEIIAGDGDPTNDSLLPIFKNAIDVCTHVRDTALSIIKHCNERIAALAAK